MTSLPPLPDVEEDYLWDPDAPVDETVASLEDELRSLKYEGRAPDFRAVRAGHGPRFEAWWAMLAAAAVVALVIGAQLAGSSDEVATAPAPPPTTSPVPSPAPEPVAPAAPTGWRLDVIGGAPTCDGAVVDGTTRLRPGVWLDTHRDARARLAIADIGWAELGPGTRLRITEPEGAPKVVELERGAIEVDVTGPAESFEVRTPFGRVVDLGCHYHVDVQPEHLSVEVSAGIIVLRRDGAAVEVRAGQRLIASRESLGEPEPIPERLELRDTWDDDSDDAPVWGPP